MADTKFSETDNWRDLDASKFEGDLDDNVAVRVIPKVDPAKPLPTLEVLFTKFQKWTTITSKIRKIELFNDIGKIDLFYTITYTYVTSIEDGEIDTIDPVPA